MAEAPLTKEFLAERDLRIFNLRKSGIPINEIARRFGLSNTATNNAIRRQLQKLNNEALLAYPELLRLELERLDTLQQALWPQTQNRKIKTDDGQEITLEPDIKAVQQVLAIMEKRTKLLGITGLTHQDEPNETPQRAQLADATDHPSAIDEYDPETEARRLIQLMGEAGVLPSHQTAALLQLQQTND
jgi:lambda repressor-like predicted transcriptional regulator